MNPVFGLVAIGAGAGVILVSRLLPEAELFRIDGFPHEAVALALLVPALLVAIAGTARPQAPAVRRQHPVLDPPSLPWISPCPAA